MKTLRLARPVPLLLLLTIAAGSLHGAGCMPPKKPSETKDEVNKKLNLVGLYMESNRYPEALVMVSDLAKRHPKDPDVMFNLGVAQFGAHDYPAAEAALEEAIRLDPRKSDVYNYLGAVEFSLGEEAKKRGDTAEAKVRYDRALESYRKAISDPLFQSRQQVYLSIADVHDSMGDAEAALRSAREAIEIDPRYYAAHFKVAVLLDRVERTREAIEEYEIAAPGFASDTNYHYRLGVAYFRDRKPDLARDHLAMVVAAAPGTEKARKAKEFLDLIGAPATAAPPARPDARAVRP